MEKIKFNNIGLVSYANNNVCVLGEDIKLDEGILKKELCVDILRTRIAGTNMVGALINGDGKKIFVPEIIFENELETLKQSGLSVEVIKTRYTALGNNLLIANRKILQNPLMRIKLGEPFSIGGYNIIGSCAVINTNGGIVNPDATSEELDFLESFFGVKIGIGTVNFGIKMVKSGMLINDTGIIVGGATTGPELIRLKEIFE